MREEKTRDPVDVRCAATDPLGEEIDTCITVFNPGCEWLQRKETLLYPCWWNLVVINGICHLLKVLTHYDFTNKCFLDLFEANSHLGEKSVVSDALLEQYGIHGLLIAGWISIRNRLKVKDGWCQSLEVTRLSSDD